MRKNYVTSVNACTPELMSNGIRMVPDWKPVTDRLIAVRETGVSRHQGAPIEGPTETARTSEHYHSI